MQAGRLVLKDIKGAFAFVAMSLDFPGELFVSRNSSPLAIGLGHKSNFVGSDAHSIDHLTQRIIYLEDDSLYPAIKLMSFLMLEVATLGLSLGINPFDQPAVERVKILTKKNLNKYAKN